tara:strand:+ start:860 stop:1036 length:177 start_codon:yes stop_codon:yes gene_type:complete
LDKIMNNEPMTYEETYGYDHEDKDEQELTTQRLLEAVCDGVVLPTEEEEQRALESQNA